MCVFFPLSKIILDSDNFSPCGVWRLERPFDFQGSLVSSSRLFFVLIGKVLAVFCQISIVEYGYEDVIYLFKPVDSRIPSTVGCYEGWRRQDNTANVLFSAYSKSQLGEGIALES